MKVNSLLILLLLICVISTLGQSLDDVIKIEFTTSTRGYYKQITITRDSIITHKEDRRTENKDSSAKKMRTQDWDKLMHSLTDVLLAELPLLKSPSSNRSSDGARASSIAITASTGMIWNHDFDNENPHEKLQRLMKEIAVLSKD